jgi:hypothetical protein
LIILHLLTSAATPLSNSSSHAQILNAITNDESITDIQKSLICIRIAGMVKVYYCRGGLVAVLDSIVDGYICILYTRCTSWQRRLWLYGGGIGCDSEWIHMHAIHMLHTLTEADHKLTEGADEYLQVRQLVCMLAYVWKCLYVFVCVCAFLHVPSVVASALDLTRLRVQLMDVLSVIATTILEEASN